MAGEDRSGTPFSVSITRRRDVTVVAVTGELDMVTSPRLQAAVDEVADGSLVVDLSRVTFLQSVGITVLVSTYNRYAQRRPPRAGEDFVVVAGDDTTHRLLVLIGIDRVLPLFTDVESAVRHLDPRRNSPMGA